MIVLAVTSCGLGEIMKSPEGKERAAEARDKVLDDPSVESALKETSDYLVWLLTAWVSGDRIIARRRRKKHIEKREKIEEQSKTLEKALISVHQRVAQLEKTGETVGTKAQAES